MKLGCADPDDDFDDLDTVEPSSQKDSIDLKNRPKLFFFSMVDGYKPEKDASLDEYLNNFKV